MTPEELETLRAGLPEAIRSTPNLRAATMRVEDVDENARTVVSVVNTAAIDRHRTIVLPRGARLDNFRNNPVVLFNHDAQSAPIGQCLWIKYEKSKNRLLAKTAFDTDPFSDMLFEKVKAETMRAWSIRFEPDYTKSGPPTEDEVKADKALKEVWYVYRAWDLLEYSLVTIQSNTDCLTVPDERAARVPQDLAAYLAELDAEDVTTRFEQPPAEPAPAPTPALPELPSLDGARTFDRRLAEALAPIRNARFAREAARGLDDAIGRARGRI